MLVVVAFLLLFALSNCNNNCENQLIWNKRYTGAANSYTLQVCCNVSNVWAAKVQHPWRIIMPAAIDHVPVTNLSLFHDEFVVSVCNGDVLEGMIHDQNGTKCERKRGDILRIEDKTFNALYGQFDDQKEVTSQEKFNKPNKDQKPYKGFKDNGWYVFCYQFQKKNCYKCSLELFCASRYHPECMKIWIDRSIGAVTNESMEIIVAVGGALPFSNSQLSISVYDQSTMLPVFKEDQLAPKLNTSHSVTADQLVPGRWYKVKVCLNFEIPAQIITEFSLQSLETSQEHCLESQAYRMMSAGSNRIGFGYRLLLFMLTTVSVLCSKL